MLAWVDLVPAQRRGAPSVIVSGMSFSVGGFVAVKYIIFVALF